MVIEVVSFQAKYPTNGGSNSLCAGNRSTSSNASSYDDGSPLPVQQSQPTLVASDEEEEDEDEEEYVKNGNGTADFRFTNTRTTATYSPPPGSAKEEEQRNTKTDQSNAFQSATVATSR